jgi:hypothetical protein
LSFRGPALPEESAFFSEPLRAQDDREAGRARMVELSFQKAEIQSDPGQATRKEKGQVALSTTYPMSMIPHREDIARAIFDPRQRPQMAGRAL